MFCANTGVNPEKISSEIKKLLIRKMLLCAAEKLSAHDSGSSV
jgi:hypothetical protein